jgi:CheY-like chemotaxis protein
MATSLLILLVEDNPHNRLLYSMALQEHGHRVIEAPSGEKALLIGSLQQPDLILLDIGLPGVSGLNVATELRAQPGLRQAPIIAVTAQRLQDAEMQEAGIDDVIYKPVNPFELAARIGDWWDEWHRSSRPDR